MRSEPSWTFAGGRSMRRAGARQLGTARFATELVRRWSRRRDSSPQSIGGDGMDGALQDPQGCVDGDEQGPENQRDKTVSSQSPRGFKGSFRLVASRRGQEKERQQQTGLRALRRSARAWYPDRHEGGSPRGAPRPGRRGVTLVPGIEPVDGPCCGSVDGMTSGTGTDVLRYTAFSSDPAGGNPAGVVLDASGLDEQRMLALAAEVGYSETAFVTEADPDRRMVHPALLQSARRGRLLRSRDRRDRRRAGGAHRAR